MKDTKELILTQSLELFSSRGYDGVSMTDIATAVGIKAASIYKHFTGKDDIFQSIIARFEEKTALVFEPELPNEIEYASISPKMLTGMIQQTFQLYAIDPFLSKCRKLFMISAFDRPEIGAIYAKYFITTPMQYQEEIFTLLQKQGVFLELDAGIMSYHFYTPILILLQEYDYRMLTVGEALDRIESMVIQFSRIYSLEPRD